MLVLGISGALSFPYENIYNFTDFQFHDASAVLVDDGKVVYAVEEERLNRIKHTNKAPISAMKFCLEEYGADLDQVDRVAVYFQENYLDGILQYFHLRNPQVGKFLKWREYVHRMIVQAFGKDIDDKKIVFVPHHIAHAESAYSMSGFDKSLVLVIDGRGDGGSGILQLRDGFESSLLDTYEQSLSLGVFYLDIILYLGYKMFDEYKVMGLAPYGNPEKYRRPIKKIYSLLPNGKYEIKRQFVNMLFGFISPRRSGEPFTQDQKDLAAALQEALETIVLHILTYHREKTNCSRLCLAGGVAHNCSLNGKLLYSGMFEDIFVQPAAHDAGGALGSALFVANRQKSCAGNGRLKHVYWGSDIGEDKEVFRVIKEWENFISFEKMEDTAAGTAKLLSDGYVVGWVQGRSEFGPRALGNRSIVADPRPAENKDIINEMIKKRESYRPFAPAILEEDLEEYYVAHQNLKEFPFMNFVLKTKEDKQALLGAVTHVDGTARVQSVSKQTNPTFWNLINEFKRITGTPILLNTSFNNNAEPIVDSAEDAIVCYLTTKLHYLVIGDYLITKKPFDYKNFYSARPLLPLHAVLSQNKNYVSFERAEQSQMIRVNYSDSYSVELSADMYSILTHADGKKTMEELFRDYGVEDMDKKNALIDELVMLWAKRVLVIRPA